MCSVSMVVSDWMNPGSPNYIPGFHEFKQLPNIITPDLAAQMLEVIRRLDEIDKRLNAVDCKLKEPQKKAIVRKLKRRAKR